MWSATLRFHLKNDAWETRIRRDRELVLSERFARREQATRWADEVREFIKRGWTVSGPV
jgi:hypothetical protein